MIRLSRQTLRIEAGLSLLLAAALLFFHSRIDEWIVEAMPAAISPATFPVFVTRVLIIMSLALVAVCIRDLYRMRGGAAIEEEGEPEDGRLLPILGYVAILFLYLAGLNWLGFVVATPVAMLAVGLLLGIRRRAAGLASYIAFTLLLNDASFRFMQIILPQGSLFE